MFSCVRENFGNNFSQVMSMENDDEKMDVEELKFLRKFFVMNAMKISEMWMNQRSNKFLRMFIQFHKV